MQSAQVVPLNSGQQNDFLGWGEIANILIE